MSDKNKKNSSNNYIYVHNKDAGKSEIIWNIFDEMTKNKDILLQVRINEQYNKKITMLEEMLSKNRSEVIRLAVDNLFDSCLLKEKPTSKNSKELKRVKIQEEILFLLRQLEHIYDTNNIDKYMKALRNKIRILEEGQKKEER